MVSLTTSCQVVQKAGIYYVINGTGDLITEVDDTGGLITKVDGTGGLIIIYDGTVV